MLKIKKIYSGMGVWKVFLMWFCFGGVGGGIGRKRVSFEGFGGALTVF